MVLITGKEFPDRNTRRFSRKLADCLSIPIFIMVGCDPHGIEIACIYKFRSRVSCEIGR